MNSLVLFQKPDIFCTQAIPFFQSQRNRNPLCNKYLPKRYYFAAIPSGSLKVGKIRYNELYQWRARLKKNRKDKNLVVVYSLCR